MATLDWIVLGLFCLALVGVILWVLSKKDKAPTLNTPIIFLEPLSLFMKINHNAMIFSGINGHFSQRLTSDILARRHDLWLRRITLDLGETVRSNCGE